MSLPIATVGDKTTGHDCHPPQTIVEGSPTVFLNGKAVARQGDAVTSHTCGNNTHGGVISSGSGTIIVNGRPAAQIGSAVSCGGAVASGAANVYGG
jgi:uncharacterized Zn-binding protein involved in type VI secretion